MRGEFSGLRWACATIAPWCLASGLLMSFTASADVEASAGGSRAVREVEPTAALLFRGRTRHRRSRRADRARDRGEPPARALAYAAVRTKKPKTVFRAAAPRIDLKRDVQRFSERRASDEERPLIQLRPAFGQGSGHDGELAAATFGRTGPARADERALLRAGRPLDQPGRRHEQLRRLVRWRTAPRHARHAAPSPRPPTSSRRRHAPN